MGQSLKIANVMLAKGRGGLESVAIDYASGLQDEGHDVMMFLHQESLYRERLEKEGVPFLTFRPFGMYDFVAKRTFRRALKEFQPDIVITHGRRALIFVGRPNAKIIGVAHSVKTDYLKDADIVLTLTPNIVLPFEKTTYYLPNMLEVSSKKYPHRTFNTQPRVFGILSRFSKEKGVALAIDAFYTAKKKGAEFHLLIAGEGEEEPSLKKVVEKYGLQNEVTFLGWVHEKGSFFDKIDCFILPSFKESFGTVILEAWRYGVPVLATNTVGASHLIKSDETGWLVDIGDKNQITEAILRMTTREADQLQKVTQKAHEKLLKTYEKKVVMQKLSAFLENAL